MIQINFRFSPKIQIKLSLILGHAADSTQNLIPEIIKFDYKSYSKFQTESQKQIPNNPDLQLGQIHYIQSQNDTK